MTNELEKTFFDTFGIEPHYYCANEYIFEAMLEDECTDSNREKCKTCKKVGKTYPQISDRILLELICILTKRFDYADQNWLTKCNDIKELKVSVLRLLLLCTTNTIEKYKHQVRTLFEEG